MVRKSEDIKPRIVYNARGGENEVIYYDWIKPEEIAGYGRMLSKLVIPPGSSIGYHEHDGEIGAYYVLSGEATVNDNGNEVVLHPGDMTRCGAGCAHSTKNNGTEDLVLMALIMEERI